MDVPCLPCPDTPAGNAHFIAKSRLIEVHRNAQQPHKLVEVGEPSIVHTLPAVALLTHLLTHLKCEKLQGVKPNICDPQK